MVIAVGLLASEAAVRIVGFAPVYRAIGRVFRVRRPGAGTSAQAEAIASRVAAINARLRPRRAACMGRALVTWAALRTRGLDAQLRLGARSANDALEAHAWVEHDDVPLAEAEGVVASYAAFPLRPEHLGLRAG